MARDSKDRDGDYVALTVQDGIKYVPYSTSYVGDSSRNITIREKVTRLTMTFKAKLEATQGDDQHVKKLLASFNWEKSIEATIAHYAALGEKWDDPVEQDRELKRIWIVLLISQISELFYAGSIAVQSIFDYRNSLSLAASIPIGILLTIQAIVTAIVNFNGIDRDAESSGKVRPTLRLGDRILEGDLKGTHERAAIYNDETKKYEATDATFEIDSRFVPDNADYNPRLVEYYNHLVSIRDREPKKWLRMNRLSAYVSRETTTFTNYMGAAGNWPVIGWLLSSAPIAVTTVIGLLSLGIIEYAGNEYYIAFNDALLEQSRKKNWTSESPYNQVWAISWIQALEVKSQWYPLAFLRALGIVLGNIVVLTYLHPMFNWMFRTSIFPELNENTQPRWGSDIILSIEFVLSIITFLCSFKNTTDTRNASADVYLRHFKITGPLQEKLTVAKKAALEFKNAYKAEGTQLTAGEIIKNCIIALGHGATWGLPTGIWLFYGAECSILISIICSLATGTMKTFLNGYSRLTDLKHEKQRQYIEAYIAGESKDEMPVAAPSERTTN